MQGPTEDKRDEARNSFYRYCEKLEQACMDSVLPYESLLGDLNNKCYSLHISDRYWD